MAAGDKYIDCNNKNLSIESFLRKLTYKDANNKPYFGTNSSVGPIPPDPEPPEEPFEYIIEPLQLMAPWSERDGAFLAKTTNFASLFNGWDENLDPKSKNERWITPNGIDFNQLDNAPWPVSHTCGNGRRPDGLIWKWGGDDQLTPGTAQTDVWTYDDINDVYNLVTLDWGPIAGNRWGYSYCVYKQWIYLIGGSVNNVVRSLDGINWEWVCDFPEGYSSFSGYACVLGNDIYAVQGVSSVNTFKLVNGVTFEALPNLIGDMTLCVSFCRLSVLDNIIFFIAGSGESGNQFWVFYTTDKFQTWRRLSTHSMATSHAVAELSTTLNDGVPAIYAISGNENRRSHRIKRVLPYTPLTQKFSLSVRLKNPTYTGKIFTVRNDLAADLDVYAVAGFVNTAAIVAHAAGGDAKIAYWSDQFQNGFDLSQSNYAVMPKIVIGGVLFEENGKAAVKWESGDYMVFNGLKDITSKYVISSVINLEPGTRIFLRGETNNGYMIYNYSGSTIYHGNGNDTYTFNQSHTGIFTSGSQRILQVARNRMILDFYENGVIMPAPFYSTGADGLGTFWDTPFKMDRIGEEYGFGQAFIGSISEINGHTGISSQLEINAIQEEMNNFFATFIP